jgi:actin-like ATPase involved in cell morphogenesis
LVWTNSIVANGLTEYSDAPVGGEPGEDAGFAAGEETVVGYQLGIDIGTTYTAAAVCRSSDHRWVEPETVTLGTRSATIPSVLFIAPDGSVVVGEAAERRALTDPGRVVREFKRRIGDPTPIVVGGQAWAPEDLSARLVRWVVDRVAEREGGAAACIALTHPASWGSHKKELLVNALAAQGLTVSFLAEPQAAALHYATEERVAPGSTIAVYDLGGGTFDAAVVRKADRSDAAFGGVGFGLLGRPEGLDRLGGVDFDEVVFDHVRDGLPAAFADLDDTDPRVLSAVARVRRECTEAKEALSADTDVSIPVLLPAASGSVRLHRSEFEGLIREQVEETVEALRKAVKSAGCAPEALTAVLLVGGSSRIPLVAQLVSDGLGRPVAVDTDPKNAIAKGAALSVSPKPTASWPEVAIPLVVGDQTTVVLPTDASAHAVGSAADGAAAKADPAPVAAAELAPVAARPPVRAGRKPVAAGPVALFGADGGRHASGLPDLPGGAPNRPVVAGGEAVEGWESGSEAPSRRPIGLLVGVGGLLAVAAIILTALLVPRLAAATSPGIVTESGTSAPTTSATAPAVAPAPAPADPAPNAGGQGPKPTRLKPSTGGGGAVAPTVNPPAVTPPATVAPAPTTVPTVVPPTATVPATTEPAPTGTTTVGEGATATQSPGDGGTTGVTPVGTGSGGGTVTPVGTGSGSGSGVIPVGTGSGGSVTPVGTGSSGSSPAADPTAATPTVSA